MLMYFKHPMFGRIAFKRLGNKVIGALAYDVTKALGYANPEAAIKEHCTGIVMHEMLTEEDHRWVQTDCRAGSFLCTNAQRRSHEVESVEFHLRLSPAGVFPSMSSEFRNLKKVDVPFVTEQDIHKLVYRSPIPDAGHFAIWVFHWVLPAIQGRESKVYDVHNDIHTMEESGLSGFSTPPFSGKRKEEKEGSVHNEFWIAETSVTYRLWYAVYMWAIGQGYTFANSGQDGSGGRADEPPTKEEQQPVVGVSFRDSIVWCNALSEMLGLDPVYTYKGMILRDATSEKPCDHAVQERTNGFRLPTTMEWALAARYRGDNDTYGAVEYPKGERIYWTPDHYASGAIGPATIWHWDSGWKPSSATLEVCWCSENSGGGTMPVGEKRPNSLGLFDMCGNVEEWTFTIAEWQRKQEIKLAYELTRMAGGRTVEERTSMLCARWAHGGSWKSRAIYMEISRVKAYPTDTTSNTLSFRLAQNDLWEHGRHKIRFQGKLSSQEISETLESGPQNCQGVVGFSMRLAPSACFPTGIDDSGDASVKQAFWIAETPVTYELWYEVRKWMWGRGYTLRKLGQEGDRGQAGRRPIGWQYPVAFVNWLDCVVWCNALSERFGLEPVYTLNGLVVKDAIMNGKNESIRQEDTNGFRLPTSLEWELAARYQGNDDSYGAIERGGLYWTPGNYASGARGPAWVGDNESDMFKKSRGAEGDPEVTQEVAWYHENSMGSIQPVGRKRANGLGLYDMSGNVGECCFDYDRGTWWLFRGGYRAIRFLSVLQLAKVGRKQWDDSLYVGLRLARTAF